MGDKLPKSEERGQKQENTARAEDAAPKSGRAYGYDRPAMTGRPR
jgi:hypothetical protein